MLTYTLGLIQCRLPQNTQAIRELGVFFKRRQIDHHQPYFLLQQQYSMEMEQISLPSDVIEHMIKQYLFKMPPVSFRVATRLLKTTMMLCLREGQRLPISGFPRELMLEEPGTSTSQ